MARLGALREVLLAFIAVVATAVGVVAAGWMALVIGAFIGAIAVLIDVLLFDRPVRRHSRAGGRTLASMSVIAIACALALTFVAGEKIRSDPGEYLFLVSNESDSLVPIRAAPGLNASTTDVLSPGERVHVSCYVDQADGRWFMLTDDDGWLAADNAFAAPHKGMGSPPRCPD